MKEIQIKTFGNYNIIITELLCQFQKPQTYISKRFFFLHKIALAIYRIIMLEENIFFSLE